MGLQNERYISATRHSQQHIASLIFALQHNSWPLTFQTRTWPLQFCKSNYTPLHSSHNIHRTMMTSSNGNIFRVTGPFCGEFTGHRWIPRTKTSDTELWCFLWSAPWINGWVNNREAGDLSRHRTYYDVIVMKCWHGQPTSRTTSSSCRLVIWDAITPIMKSL